MMNWQNENSLMYSIPDNIQYLGKIAAFDMDGTLIKTKSGKRFPKDLNDWKLFDDTYVKSTLQSLYDDNYTLVIISNQNGISKGKVTANEIQTKISNLLEVLELQFVVLINTEDDHMRKPRIGAWEFLIKKLGPVKEGFYCGDAAGRTNDFAASDYKFALNLNIPFKTPEALFLKSTEPIHTNSSLWNIGFDPRTLPISNKSFVKSNEQEIIILCGPPASGKSTFAQMHCSDYDYINQDELKTLSKCKKACIASINAQKSIIIDATNRDIKTRKEWIEIAKKHNLPIRCVKMEVDKPLCMHLNKYRNVYGSKTIPTIAIHVFFKKYEPPVIEEGYSDIIEWEFSLTETKNMITLFME